MRNKWSAYAALRLISLEIHFFPSGDLVDNFISSISININSLVVFVSAVGFVALAQTVLLR